MRISKAKWAAMLEAGRAAIEMHVIERARKSFDPDELDFGDVEPKVTVSEAIKIAQLNARDAAADPFAEQAAQMSEEDVHALSERLLSKIGWLEERTERERLGHGWTRDEATGHLVPPGWTRNGE